MTSTIVAGVGMTPFKKPGESDTYDVMALEAVRQALHDAGLSYADVQQAYAGYIFGDSTAGQRVVYSLGMTGIPVVNVHNNCSTGSTALFLARQAVESGAVDCALAFGFEQMGQGALASQYADRPSPLGRFVDLTQELAPHEGIPLAIHFFCGAGIAHMRKYGTRLETFAKIRSKASRHAKNNPLAIFRAELTEDEVLQSQAIWPGVMTRLMACPPTCGAAAAIIVSERFAKRTGLSAGVTIVAQAMVTDLPSTFDDRDMMKLVGYDLGRVAASMVYEAAGVGPADIDVAELHDCFVQNELILYEALGFCPEGGAERFIEEGSNTYGGEVVTNPSGGLLSKGHPLGATGLAQCYELTQQLRGTAEARQVSGARWALQHNIGLGSACVVTLYGKG